METPNYGINGYRVWVSSDPNYTPPKKEKIMLTPLEQEAITIILSALKCSSIDVSLVDYQRTQSYLKVLYPKVYDDGLVFDEDICRLKLFGRLFYMYLPINYEDAKQLRFDPRFEGIVIGKKLFSRIPIIGPADIEKYTDIIVLCFNSHNC